MIESRIRNSKRNIIIGVIKQIILILIPFLNKTILLYYMGAEYQGLNGLFISILQVLNLADLGFSSAVVFILYKPLAEENTTLTCQIMAYLKRIYKIIGFAMLFLGLLFVPFLDKLIAGTYPADINIYLLYIIYLVNVVLSYLLFGYKSALLTATQRDDMISKISIISTLFVGLFQIIVLILTKNFYLYTIIFIFGTIINNLLLEYFSKKYFPNIIPNGKINKETKYILNKQVKAIFIGKIADVARNSFDNIILSFLFGLKIVAIYSNYFYIFSSLYGFMLVITHAVSSSVGNSVTSERIEKNRNDFFKFNFIFSWFIGLCTICMLNLYQPFMRIWMNNNQDLLLSNFDVVLFCIYFYLINATNVINMYIEANGLFWECKYWYILEALGNLILNIILGYTIGISGVIIATIITILFFNFFPRTHILFKHYFKISKIKFYFSQLFYLIVTICISVLCAYLISFINLNDLLKMFIILIICITLPNILYIIIYHNFEIFKISKIFIKDVLFNRSFE